MSLKNIQKCRFLFAHASTDPEVEQKMSMKWKIEYSVAAVLGAIAIISVALIANPTLLPKTANAASFTVMLTDPLLCQTEQPCSI